MSTIPKSFLLVLALSTPALQTTCDEDGSTWNDSGVSLLQTELQMTSIHAYADKMPSHSKALQIDAADMSRSAMLLRTVKKGSIFIWLVAMLCLFAALVALGVMLTGASCCSKDIMVWRFSVGRMHAALTGLVIAPTITFVMCFYQWWGAGCDPSLPFISELGMHRYMRFCFATGLTITAIIFFSVWVDIINIRSRVMCRHGSGGFWWLIHILHTISGLSVVVGLGALGYLPVDIYFYAHGECSLFILQGGSIWSILNVMMTTYMRISLGVGTGWMLTRISILFSLVGNVSAIYFMVGYMMASAQFTDYFLLTREAQYDFFGYCRPGSTRMDNTLLNMAALFEWMAVLTLLLGVCGSTLIDVDIYASVIRSGSGTETNKA